LAATPFYKVIDHTADVGIEVEAASPEDAFVGCGLAMFDLMVGLESVGGDVTVPVRVEGDGPAELLVAWLNELLYFYAVKRVVFSGFAEVELGEQSFRAVGCGELFNPSKHRGEMEIKAATYHNASLAHVGDRWIARVIFDI
jgi:SHS2 domain-containing protein